MGGPMCSGTPRDLPWDAAPSMGGTQRYRDAEEPQTMEFGAMMESARSEYKKNRSQSAGRQSASMRSQSRRFKENKSWGDPDVPTFSSFKILNASPAQRGKGFGASKSERMPVGKLDDRPVGYYKDEPPRVVTNKAHSTMGHGSRAMPWEKPEEDSGDSNQVMDFNEMLNSSRRAVNPKLRSASNPKPSVSFRSQSPRLQSPNATSPFSKGERTTPGPGEGIANESFSSFNTNRSGSRAKDTLLRGSPRFPDGKPDDRQFVNDRSTLNQATKSKRQWMDTTAPRDLPWEKPASMGGIQDNNKSAPEAIDFSEMMSNARSEYKTRVQAGKKGGAMGRSQSPRLQSPNATSPFSKGERTTPGPGEGIANESYSSFNTNRSGSRSKDTLLRGSPRFPDGKPDDRPVGPNHSFN